MRRLSALAMIFGSLMAATQSFAGQALPEQFPYFGAHFSEYRVNPDAYGDDFIEEVRMPGLQAGYRFPGNISAQVWWERNNTRYGVSGRKADLNVIMASMRFHAPKLFLGVEPYAGLGAGEITFDVGSDENDESFMSLELGFQNRIRPHWLLDVGVRAPHSFDDDRWDSEYYIGLNHLFGINAAAAVSEKKEEVPLVAPPPTLRDSDRDGVPDTVDECPNTPAGSRVTNTGCLVPPNTP